MKQQREVDRIKAQPLRQADLAQQPMVQFTRWYRQAEDVKLSLPHAMSLATADENGRVASRLVLLRHFDERGFVFFTSLETSKVWDIAKNLQVALLFPWLLLERQVRVEGTAVPLSRGETLRHFLSRPRASQLAVWFTQQSGAVSSRAVLQKQWAAMKQKYRQGRIPLPDSWGGYRVQPRRVEFWQGRADAVHDRFEYLRQADGSWTIMRLRP